MTERNGCTGSNLSMIKSGTLCSSDTKGLLKRAHIKARTISPIGKETDRRWEQGEDPSMVDSEIFIYSKRKKRMVVDESEGRGWTALGFNRLKENRDSAKQLFQTLLRAYQFAPGPLLRFGTLLRHSQAEKPVVRKRPRISDDRWAGLLFFQRFASRKPPVNRTLATKPAAERSIPIEQAKPSQELRKKAGSIWTKSPYSESCSNVCRPTVLLDGIIITNSL
jgi:hypothetical protein